jgi:hypothetical protein
VKRIRTQDFVKLTENTKYSNVLGELLEELQAIKILDFDYIKGNAGYVHVAVELKNGHIFVYQYKYGYNCFSDDWENKRLKNRQIKSIMEHDGLFFKNHHLYKRWRCEMQARAIC